MNTIPPAVLKAAEHPQACVRVTFHSKTKEEAIALMKEIGGEWRKESFNGVYWLSARYGVEGKWGITIFIPGMCHRVQVGETVRKASPAVPESVEPLYEYRCDPLFEVAL